MKTHWKCFLRVTFFINCCIYTIYLERFWWISPKGDHIQNQNGGSAIPVTEPCTNGSSGNYLAYKATLHDNIAAIKYNKEARKWWHWESVHCRNSSTAAVGFKVDYESWLDEPEFVVGEPVVPNVVHYLWYSREPRDIDLTQLLSILSVHVNFKPRTIYYHTNSTPTGPLWALAENLPELKVVSRQPSSCVFGETVRHNKDIQLQSDVDRLTILMRYGGVYIDTDVLFVRDLDEFRRFPFTLGMQYPKRANNAVIISSRHSLFLLMWLNSFIDNFSHVWAENSGVLSLELGKRFPHLVRLHWGYFYKPDLKTLDRLYGGTIYDWWNNYFIHLWKSNAGQSLNITVRDVVNANSTFGQLATCILYKAKDIIQNYFQDIDFNRQHQACVH